MSDQATTIDELLHAATHGDPAASDELIGQLYIELRRLAQSMLRNERPGHTLQATALVHEAYLRLLGGKNRQWADRRHFFNTAALVMRRQLIDHGKKKRIDANTAVDNVEIPATAEFQPDEYEAVDDALKELTAHKPRCAEVVSLRLFNGLSMDEIAEVIGTCKATVSNDWRFAIAWLHRRVEQTRPVENGAQSAESTR